MDQRSFFEGEIVAKLGSIDQRLTEIKADLSDRLREMQKDLDHQRDRISRLEMTQARITTIGSIAMVLLTVGMQLVSKLWK